MRTFAEYRVRAEKKLAQADRDDGNSLTPSALEALRALADDCRPDKPAVVRQLHPRPHPYSLKIRPCSTHAGRFRWEILDSDGVLGASWVSFATEREAEEGGRRELQSLVETWKL